MLVMARKSPFVSMGGIHSNETTVREPPSPSRNNIGGNQEADDERLWNGWAVGESSLTLHIYGPHMEQREKPHTNCQTQIRSSSTDLKSWVFLCACCSKKFELCWINIPGLNHRKSERFLWRHLMCYNLIGTDKTVDVQGDNTFQQLFW